MSSRRRDLGEGRPSEKNDEGNFHPEENLTVLMLGGYVMIQFSIEGVFPVNNKRDSIRTYEIWNLIITSICTHGYCLIFEKFLPGHKPILIKIYNDVTV